MHPQTRRGLVAFSIVALAFCCLIRRVSIASATPTNLQARRVQLYRTRQSDTDLEIIGMVAGLPSGATGYVHYADLLSLPQITFGLKRDENFVRLKQSVTITGVYLEDVAQALSASRDADLIAANCVDGYQAHYPSSYIAAHHPVLALKINQLSPSAWSRKFQQADPGPYFITHEHFVPAFKVLSHADQPQVPANLIQLEFNTTAATFGALAPRDRFASGSPEQQGFAIAKQNCLRCHNQGQYGGKKSGRDWLALGTWAREQPVYFANYVQNPKAYDVKAKMPGNPQYDAATLAALTAYFETFTDAPMNTN